MIKVTVKWLVHFGSVRGDESFILPDHSNFSDLLNLFYETFGDAFTEYIYEAGSKELRGDLNFLLNGRNIRSKSLDEKELELKDGDRLLIIPFLAGG